MKNVKNVLYYLQGNIRYKLFYTKFSFLISKHIKEQIVARIASMEPRCFNEGQCELCGCNTTALQMCNKPCDKPCYPKMLTRKGWNYLKRAKVARIDGIVWIYENDKFINLVHELERKRNKS